MDERGAWHGEVDPASGRRSVRGVPSAGEPYVLRVPGAPAWGYEGEAPRALAASLLIDLSGFAPLPEMTWAFCAEVVATLPGLERWTLPAADVDGWRRGWLARPAHRGVVERAFVGSLLRAPQEVEVDLAWLSDRRERVLVQAVLAAARVGVAPDLDDVQTAVDALRLGAEPDLVARRLAAAPDGPGPHFWAARLRAFAAPAGSPAAA